MSHSVGSSAAALLACKASRVAVWGLVTTHAGWSSRGGCVSHVSEQVRLAEDLLRAIVPGSRPLLVRDRLLDDECAWWLRAVHEGLVTFRECPEDCFRYRKWSVPGPDHFDTPHGAPRHMFSSPGADVPALNREYVPHIAAWARAVFDFGFDVSHSRFSFYRRYTRDLISKKQGGSYETDVEIYDSAGALHLQIEAKKDAPQVARICRQLDAAGSLAELPPGSAKELEYVMDLAPRFLWIVGPGTVDPAPHIYSVVVSGLDAQFRKVSTIPPAP